MDTRVQDMVQITKMVVDVIKTTASNPTGPASNTAGGALPGANPTPLAGAMTTGTVAGTVGGTMTGTVGGTMTKGTVGGAMTTGTMTGTEMFAAREKEQQLKDLLKECDQFISLYLSDLQTRADPRLVRTASADALIQRVRAVTMTTPSMQWTNTEILLVLQRLKDKESQLLALQEKYDVLIRDMMRMENEQDELKKRAVNAETQAGVAKQDLQQKTAELETWKQIANRPGGGGNYPIASSSPPLVSNQYAITSYST